MCSPKIGKGHLTYILSQNINTYNFLHNKFVMSSYIKNNVQTSTKRSKILYGLRKVTRDYNIQIDV